MNVERRAVLLGAVAATLGVACGGATSAPPGPPPLPRIAPLVTRDFGGLVAAARLRFIVVARPRAIAETAFLIPAIARVVPEANLDRFRSATGVDLRRVEDAVVAEYEGDDHGDVRVYLVRHGGDRAEIERDFASRLVGGERRTQERPDVARLTGHFGRGEKTLELLGSDVAVFQDGGSATRGPARVAELFATGKLKKSPAVFEVEPLKSLAARFGPQPVRAFALGPFEGELAKAARGLLAGATAVGAAARPSARERVALSIAVSGDFAKSGEAASTELLHAWEDLARSSFGHLLGLDSPVEKPLPTFAADAVAIALELDPDALARGLAEATSERLDQLLR